MRLVATRDESPIQQGDQLIIVAQDPPFLLTWSPRLGCQVRVHQDSVGELFRLLLT